MPLTMSYKFLFTVIIFFALIYDKLNIFLFFIISSILHELGHALACFILKCKCKIDISPFGFKLTPSLNIYSYKKFFILISGPLVNLLICFICYFILQKQFTLSCYVFMVVNLIIGLFNCLPISFLDGGQILNCICDRYYIVENIVNVLSMLILLYAIFYFSHNIFTSLVSYTIFLLYFLFSKLNDI